MRKTGLGIFLLVLALGGCGSLAEKETFPEEERKIVQLGTEFYEETAAENQEDTLENVRSLVEQFGSMGYAAIDGRNQVNMSQPDLALEFCQKVEQKEKGKLLLIEVLSPEEFVIYHFQTQEGQVNVKKRYYEWKDGSGRFRKFFRRKLEVLGKRIFDVFKRLLFRRVLRSYPERGRRVCRFPYSASAGTVQRRKQNVSFANRV